jgi:hypothetical protein
MSDKAAAFATAWARRNVNNEPMVTGETYKEHIANLRAELIEAASKDGIEADEIEDGIGDLDDFLEATSTASTILPLAV